jgi:hypothetical protein
MTCFFPNRRFAKDLADKQVNGNEKFFLKGVLQLYCPYSSVEDVTRLAGFRAYFI